MLTVGGFGSAVFGFGGIAALFLGICIGRFGSVVVRRWGRRSGSSRGQRFLGGSVRIRWRSQRNLDIVRLVDPFGFALELEFFLLRIDAVSGTPEALNQRLSPNDWFFLVIGDSIIGRRKEPNVVRGIFRWRFFVVEQVVSF